MSKHIKLVPFCVSIILLLFYNFRKFTLPFPELRPLCLHPAKFYQICPLTFKCLRLASSPSYSTALFLSRRTLPLRGIRPDTTRQPATGACTFLLTLIRNSWRTVARPTTSYTGRGLYFLQRKSHPPPLFGNNIFPLRRIKFEVSFFISPSITLSTGKCKLFPP